MIKGVIFDLDGVLCSTDEYHYLAWKSLADELDIPFDREANNRLRGVSREKSLEIILERSTKTYGEKEKKEFADRKNRRYRELLEGLTPRDVAEGVLGVLFCLKKAGIRLAVGSSSKNTPLILERLDLAQHFDAVADGNDITHSKPDPEVFLKAAERLELRPSECLVVEDAESGAAAGKAGGFRTATVGEAARLGLGDFPLRRLSDLVSIV